MPFGLLGGEIEKAGRGRSSGQAATVGGDRAVGEGFRDPVLEGVVDEVAEGERGDAVLLLGVLDGADAEHMADEVGVGAFRPRLEPGGGGDVVGVGPGSGSDDAPQVGVGGVGRVRLPSKRVKARD